MHYYQLKEDNADLLLFSFICKKGAVASTVGGGFFTSKEFSYQPRMQQNRPFILWDSAECFEKTIAFARSHLAKLLSEMTSCPFSSLLATNT
jgi:hypothetical protein